jgi:hypothetical protein
VGDDRLGTGQWECAGGGSSRERETYDVQSFTFHMFTFLNFKHASPCHVAARFVTIRIIFNTFPGNNFIVNFTAFLRT